MAAEKKPNKTVSVIGSLNIDFVTVTSRLPTAGETLAAKSFSTGYGGKGANQAVACARLATPDVTIQMIGNVGDDSFGADYLEALRKEGIDAGGVRRLEGQKTGVTNIIVEEESGENRILYVANANERFKEGQGLVGEGEGRQCRDESGKWFEVDLESRPDWAVEERSVGGSGSGDVCVFQLEIPVGVVLHNLQLAHKAGKHTILNPAPAVQLPESAYADISTLILNETEAAILTNYEKEKHDPKDLPAVCKQFLSWGVQDAVIITLGEKGLVYATKSGAEGSVPACKAKVVDTTAAGDTFVGGYAVERVKDLSASFDHAKALAFATKAAGKTVEKAGAMAAIPYLKELA